ncbi:MAG: DUF4214 domain-containing protein [Pseudomonadota bacterium]
MEPDDVTVIFGGNFLGGSRTFTGEFDYSTDQIAFQTGNGFASYVTTGRFTLDALTAPMTQYEITVFNNVVPENGGARRDAIVFEGDFTYTDGTSGELTIELATTDLSEFDDTDLPDSFELEDFELVNFVSVSDGPAALENTLSDLSTFAGPREGVEPLTVEEARTVARIYEAALDRDGNIDLAGLNFWIDQREAGLTELELASAFVDSREFEDIFGDPDELTDREFVQVLYQNILERSGEPAGVSFWEGQLGLADFDRDDLLLAFAESPENVAGTAFIATLAETEPGFWTFA